MSKYHVHQVDSNQQAIVTALEAGGCSAAKIGRPVDLLVGKNGRNYVFEVKQRTGKLRASQQAFFARWKGQAGILRSVEDVHAFLCDTSGG